MTRDQSPTLTLACVFLIWLLLVLGCNSAGTRNRSETTAKEEQVVHIDKSSEKQAQRLKAIQGLTKRGAFAKIEPDTTSKPGSGIMPSVYVRPAFYTLTIDEKEFIARLLYEYYCEGGYYDSVLFFDNYSGKKVASYHPHLGFRME